MKKISLLTIGLAVTALLAFRAAKTETFKIDTQKSNIEWTGKKVLGEHHGDIKLASGTIITEDNVPAKGSFAINMSSISNRDLTDADSKGKLLGHLKSDDFFGVAKFPEAQFAITKVTKSGNGTIVVAGNITIKGLTSAISFPATYSVNGNTLTAKAANVKVDRTKHDIKYNSKTIFSSIGDKAIDDEFILDISLVATK
ncbi:YceI family protein [Mucilaginibacter calamicampi]|uniref:YceI family protein n=1 Tax=Mucilaginibacter calamicampi TaxID=1302352 RepID=A0ABW2YWQ8_9SPHI